LSGDHIDDIDDIVVTTGRTWDDTEPWVEPVHKEPLVRARPIEFVVTHTRTGKIKGIVGDVDMPNPALEFAKAFLQLPGWTLKANYAHGWEINGDGTTKMNAVKEFTGEMTPGSERTPPRPATKTVGWTDRDPVESIMMLAYARRAEGWIRLQGLWVAGKFEEGRVAAPPGVPFALIGARELTRWRNSAPGIEVIT
jgi:hypothetical protein